MDWNTGLVVVAIICFFLGKVLLKIKETVARILFIIFVPYLLSFSLYWLIAIIEGASSEHSSWSVIFIHPWSVAGILSMGIGLFIFSRSKSKESKNA
jgi:hypothetical protein